MIEKDVFIEILESARIINNLMNEIEKALNIQMGEGYLLDALTKLMDILVDNCEHLEITGDDSYIYKYAFDNNWGNKEDSRYIKSDLYIIRDPESLYDYIKDKYCYEGRVTQNEKTNSN